MTTRKKWRIVYPGLLGGLSEVSGHITERSAYDYVEQMRTAWAAGGPTSSLTVQVDEGFGWAPYEHVDFAEEA